MIGFASARARLGRKTFAAAVALAACVVAFGVALSLAPSSAYAYDYTVRVWGGNESANEGVIHTETVEAGGEYRLSRSWAELPEGSKYYVKGFREGGQDALHTEAFVVNEDMDFVVAYGVAGDQVSYTVSYIEQGTGRALTGSESGQTSVTYYGNKGDKPVVPYEHIPGYRPLYRNITGTLGDEGTNNWTFEYVAVTQPTATSPAGTTTTTTTTGGGGAAATTGGGGATATTTGGGAATTTGGGATGTTTTTTTTGGEASGESASATPAEPETEELLDVDTPLAQNLGSGSSASASASSASADSASADNSGDQKQESGIPVPAIAGIAVALVAAAGLIFYLFRRKSSQSDGQ